MGLTVTCRCGYQWYERAADYEEPVQRPFDPCEALDAIVKASAIDMLGKGEEIRNHVHALRAYITGMER